jgi:uncharacterized hydrophobic protein (TIGR00271 family)
MASLRLLRSIAWLRDIFRIEGPIDEDGVLQLVRSDIQFKGAKAWILVAAIFIASLGLNTNSTAVIIGAMLISPLMGPIVGIGTALGIWDVGLLAKSLRNLSVAVGISLATSTMYFLITPLGDARSELIARTAPTLLDALIAIFGGLAGGIAAIRLDKSNVVPGVAIATALMPPLCTAGYGIAHGDPTFFLGAFYLFFINAVCISAAMYSVVRVSGFHKISVLDPYRARRVRAIVGTVVVLTLIPSIIIGYRIVRENMFDQRVLQLTNSIRSAFPASSVLVTAQEFHGDSSLLELTVIGETMDSSGLARVEALRRSVGLHETRIRVRQSGDPLTLGHHTVLSGAKLLDLYSTAEQALTQRTREADSLRTLLRGTVRYTSMAPQLMREAATLFPTLESMTISPNTVRIGRTGTMDTTMVITATWAHRGRAQPADVEAWLRARLNDSTIVLR